MRLVTQGRKAKISDFDYSCRSSHKDVVAFQVTVNDGGTVAVQEVQALQDLQAPVPQDLWLDALESFQVSVQSTECQNGRWNGARNTLHTAFVKYRRIPLASPGLIHAHFGDLVGLYTGWAYTRMGLYTGLK